MISERKYKILKHCAAVPSGPTSIADALKASKNTMATAMIRMEDEELLVSVDGVYSPTYLGRRGMKEYEMRQGSLVKAPSIDKFQGTYVPDMGYCRNDGNEEIRSWGVAC